MESVIGSKLTRRMEISKQLCLPKINTQCSFRFEIQINLHLFIVCCNTYFIAEHCFKHPVHDLSCETPSLVPSQENKEGWGN